MRASNFHIFTEKEAPADAEVTSQKLMLRTGMIRKQAAGIYSWTPLGLRVLRKIERIVREEMNRSGAIEVLMPAIQPAELWQESGRWSKYGPELLRLKDRHERDFVVGPTHEEVITDLVRREIRSYRQLPKHFYQVQTKFRDEIRPRFGVMRGREFIMKDGYSFHVDHEDLRREYQNMYATYHRIFSRLGLNFRAVAADGGSIGGDHSHEFHVIAETGEDDIAYNPDTEYAANVELAEALAPAGARATAVETLTKIATPQVKTIAELCEFLKIDATRTLKAIVVEAEDGTSVLLLIRGDHQLNEVKAQKIAGIKSPLTFATPEVITKAFGAAPGSLGPIGFNGRVIVDHSAAHGVDMVVGANEDNIHYTGCTPGRDFALKEVTDLRNVVEGDLAADGKGQLKICRGIEVGHIFQLRQKYSAAMNCKFLAEDGQENIMEMGCYGIGVTRLVGAAIEQNNDQRGIIWPAAIAPFSVVICPIAWSKSAGARQAAEQLYDELLAADVDVILDDRDERPGVMFAEWELIGVPHRLVIGDKGLQNGQIEYRYRRAEENLYFSTENAVQEIMNKLNSLN